MVSRGLAALAGPGDGRASGARRGQAAAKGAGHARRCGEAAGHAKLRRGGAGSGPRSSGECSAPAVVWREAGRLFFASRGRSVRELLSGTPGLALGLSSSPASSLSAAALKRSHTSRRASRNGAFFCTEMAGPILPVVSMRAPWL